MLTLSKLLTLPNAQAISETEIVCRCPNSTPESDKRKLIINLDEQQFICGHCEVVGTLEELNNHIKKWPEPTITIHVETETQLLDRFHQQLLDNPLALSELQTQFCITEDTVRKLKLGFDRQYIFPIYDSLRRLKGTYRLSTVNFADLASQNGSGFYYILRPGRPLLVVDSIPEVCLAYQYGYSGLSFSLRDFAAALSELREQIPPIPTYILMESHFREVVARGLLEIGLPASEVKSPGLRFLARTMRVGPEQLEMILQRQQLPPQKVQIEDIAQYFGHYVQVEGIITGRSEEAFLAPRTLLLRCAGQPSSCKSDICLLKTQHGLFSYSIDPSNSDFLEKILKSAELRRRDVKVEVGAIGRCRTEVVETDHTSFRSYIMRDPSGLHLVRMFGVEQDLVPGEMHKVWGYVTVMPKTNAVAIVAVKCKQLPKPYQVRAKRIKFSEFKVFRPIYWGPSEIYDKLLSEAEILSNVIGIYGRAQSLIGIDLVFFSPIEFEILGQSPARGWISILLFGDTRTGKSETCKRLIKYYDAGDWCEAGLASLAGTLGGVIFRKKEGVMIEWGKLVHCDRELLVLDNLQLMDPRDFHQLNPVRTDGIAELTRIRKDRAYARTRTIWIANPRKAMNAYLKPLHALTALIPDAQDISRFDYVIVRTLKDIPVSVIEDGITKSVDDPYQKARRNLLAWAWTRRKDQIKFESDAEQEVIRLSGKLVQDYRRIECPLIEPGEARFKLAKVAAAIAARTFSTPEGETLMVLKAHVQAAAKLLDLYHSGLFYGTVIET